MFTAFSLWRDARNKESSSAATARAERAYREAVKDREQLAGGLVLDEHARQVGGELTMQQEVGGLEVHEEVAFGFGAEDEAEEAVLEEAAEATRAVDGRGR